MEDRSSRGIQEVKNLHILQRSKKLTRKFLFVFLLVLSQFLPRVILSSSFCDTLVSQEFFLPNKSFIHSSLALNGFPGKPV